MKKSDLLKEGYNRGLKDAHRILTNALNESLDDSTLEELRAKIELIHDSLDGLYEAAASGRPYLATNAGTDWRSVVEYAKEIKKILKKVFGKNTFTHK